MALTKPFDQGYFGKKPDKETLRYNIVDGRVEECRRVTVCEFNIGDVEDPDLWAAEPLHKWENSEAGAWVMANAAETPEWHRCLVSGSYSYRYIITAKFSGVKLTEWLLRYGHSKSTI